MDFLPLFFFYHNAIPTKQAPQKWDGKSDNFRIKKIQTFTYFSWNYKLKDKMITLFYAIYYTNFLH